MFKIIFQHRDYGEEFFSGRGWAQWTFFTRYVTVQLDLENQKEVDGEGEKVTVCGTKAMHIKDSFQKNKCVMPEDMKRENNPVEDI